MGDWVGGCVGVCEGDCVGSCVGVWLGGCVGVCDGDCEGDCVGWSVILKSVGAGVGLFFFLYWKIGTRCEMLKMERGRSKKANVREIIDGKNGKKTT